MALPACFRLADDLLPRVRAAAACRLVADGWTQSRAAQALGVSQAMVSKYVAARPGAAADPLVARLAAELLDDLEAPRGAPASPWCGTLAALHERPGAGDALEDLLAAEALLRQRQPLGLVPQIGLNLARALPDAAEPQDILSYPGRLIAVDGRLLVPAPPAFGASGHLARGLLGLRAHGGTHLALASIRGGPDVAAALRRQGHAAVEPAATAPTDADGRLLHLAEAASGAAFLHDPGAVGLEPCLYVAGPDARAVAGLILDLNDTLEGT